MKAITSFYFVLLLVVGITMQGISAQHYDFTLIHNGNYSFSIAAVPNFDSGNFSPITQSYGFTLVVPDGVTISFDSYAPTGTNETITRIPGTNVSVFDPLMADKDLYLITTDTKGETIGHHSSDAIIPLVNFTVDGNPQNGELRILDNNSTLASALGINGSLDSFIQTDVTDNNTVNFTNVFNGLTGMDHFIFNTLGIEENEAIEQGWTLYPNPSTHLVYTKGAIQQLTKIEIFDIAGQLVLQQNTSLDQVDVSHMESGVYMVKLYNKSHQQQIIKLIKE
ncbi:T9SS type A sorting domain-containing protein [Aquimarina sp. 2201CG5-10]|uniref:T9SS type A sorting domain-containing protein n=1 Tax=Aquimarina callyspongiae TaxID=3098150 RepID=UPI002AB3FB46|nr:T9SS type A sorting domain-containing protein [Aquimarina sp. 2201CG5-10]MDY8134567.1 T9SS type A sorting domain-containing protein [Aquimarina sp. 2201CG5-10]